MVFALRAYGDVRVSFRVRNTGTRAGHDVAQIYVSPVAGGWESPKHLAGFAKTELAPGATRDVSVTLEPKVLARWDARAGAFRIAPDRPHIFSPGNWLACLTHSTY